MILNLVALLFVLGITFMHSMFGLYSGIINVFCSITALAVAFGFFEMLNSWVTGQFHLPPQWTEPAILAVLFVGTLAILRTITDQFMRGNVRVPMYVDWGGGAVCGFINGQIIVGVMVLSFLMLPFGGRAATFSRYQRHPDDQVDPQTGRVKFTRHDLWLKSDQFAVGLFSLLSSGSLRSTTSFASVYPDFPEWVFWSGNTIQSESPPVPIRDNRQDGFEDGIEIESWWTQTQSLDDRVVYRRQAPTRETPEPGYEPTTYEPPPGKELLGVRLNLKPGAGDPVGKQGGSPTQRFRPSMFRVVGDLRDHPQHYTVQVIGGGDKNLGDKLRVVDIDANFSPGQGDVPLDLYFAVDQGFAPRFLEYRRHAREPFRQTAFSQTPPEMRLTLGGAALAAAGGGDRPVEASGPMRFIDTVQDDLTGETNRLPFAMSASRLRREMVDLRGDRIESGRLSGLRSELEAKADDSRVEALEVPGDQRMFQIQTKTRQAASLAGQVFNFVGGTLNQYEAYSTTGDRFPLAGYYAIVDRDGQPYIELFYTPDPLGTGFNGMLDFQTEGLRGDLGRQDEARLGLIFLVPPGTTISGIRAGRGSIDFGDQTYKIGS